MDVFDCVDGGILFNLNQNKSVIGSGLLTSNELADMVQDSGLYENKEEVSISKDKVLCLNMVFIYVIYVN